MASTATTSLRLEKQGTGDNNNTWGAKLNTTALDLLDSAIAGRTTFTLSGSKTLTSTNYAADEARAIFLDITSGTGGTVTVPGVSKTYIVRNATSGNVIVTTGSGATATIPTGDIMWVVCDATNVYLEQALNLGASLLYTTGTPTLSTHLTTKSYVDATVSAAAGGVLPTSTGTGAVVLANGPTIASPTITNPTMTNPIVGTQSPSDNSTKAASTAYVDAAVGARTWTQIGSTLTLTGTSSGFSSIPATYSELYLEVLAATHGDGSSHALRVYTSSNSLEVTAAIAAATAIYAAIRIAGYDKTVGLISAAGGAMASAGLGDDTARMAAERWATTPVLSLLLGWDNPAISFTGGTAKLWGR